jgi:hypothetical protein
VRGRQNASAVLGLHGARADLLSALLELGCGLQPECAGLIVFYSWAVENEWAGSPSRRTTLVWIVLVTHFMALFFRM